MRALIDGDIIVFRCGFAAEYMMWYLGVDPYVPTDPSGAYRDEANREWRTVHEFRYKKEAMEKLDELLPGKYSRQEGEDYTLWSERVLEPFNHATQNIRTLVESILSATGTSEFDAEVYLSPANGKTFRHDLARTRPYKGQRDQSHRPTYEAELRDYLIENYKTRIADYEEADDLLAIEQTSDPKGTVLCSLDKDLDQVPGLKYNFTQDRLYEVKPEQAHYNFHMQLMTGDSTDNVPGLPGIGPGKAAKALHGINDPFEQLQEVWRMYQIHSGTEDPWEYLREQGKLVYIRREPGEDWEPDSLIKEDAAWDAEALSLL